MCRFLCPNCRLLRKGAHSPTATYSGSRPSDGHDPYRIPTGAGLHASGRHYFPPLPPVTHQRMPGRRPERVPANSRDRAAAVRHIGTPRHTNGTSRTEHCKNGISQRAKEFCAFGRALAARERSYAPCRRSGAQNKGPANLHKKPKGARAEKPFSSLRTLPTVKVPRAAESRAGDIFCRPIQSAERSAAKTPKAPALCGGNRRTFCRGLSARGKIHIIPFSSSSRVSVNAGMKFSIK